MKNRIIELITLQVYREKNRVVWAKNHLASFVDNVSASYRENSQARPPMRDETKSGPTCGAVGVRR